MKTAADYGVPGAPINEDNIALRMPDPDFKPSDSRVPIAEIVEASPVDVESARAALAEAQKLRDQLEKQAQKAASSIPTTQAKIEKLKRDVERGEAAAQQERGRTEAPRFAQQFVSAAGEESRQLSLVNELIANSPLGALVKARHAKHEALVNFMHALTEAVPGLHSLYTKENPDARARLAEALQAIEAATSPAELALLRGSIPDNHPAAGPPVAQPAAEFQPVIDALIDAVTPRVFRPGLTMPLLDAVGQPNRLPPQ